MVNIFTDSTSDLGEFAAQHRVSVIPLSVTLGGRNYLDGVDIQAAQLFDLVSQVGELPKTAAPSVGEYRKAFEAAQGECIYVGISSRLSASVQNARLAAEMLPAGRVRVIDSLNLSTGIGLLALRAAELRDRGLDAAQVEKELLATIAKVHASFMVDTMDYLYKGGRCSALQALAGSMLKIRPVIEVRGDGTLGVREKARGVRQKGLDLLLDDFAAHLPKLDRSRVFVTHAAAPEDARMLADAVRRLAAPKEVCITTAGSVISSHCGPGTIGILYLEQ
jgi:DegV family protein with EDD domain